MIRFLVVLWLLWAPTARASQEVFVVLSAGLKPYLEFAEGFQEEVHPCRLFFLPEEAEMARHLLREPREVVAVGTRALRLVSDFEVRRLFYALVVSPEVAQALCPGRQLCGLYLRLPPETTLPTVKRTLSEKLGRDRAVILLPYSSPENRPFARQAREVGRQLGLEVKAHQVARADELLELIRQEDFDLLYCVPDPLYATEEIISVVLRLSLLRGKAVCGYNHFFAEKGALISFVFDYREVGREAGRRWVKRLCGPAPAPFQVILNKKVLDFLRQRAETQKHKNSEGLDRGRR